MRSKLAILLLTPPFIVLMTRIVLPIHFQIHVLELSTIGVFHTLYLLVLGAIILKFLLASRRSSLFCSDEPMFLKRGRTVVLIGLLIMLIISPKPVLIGGSDVLPAMILQRPYLIWFIDGISRILLVYGIVVVVFSGNRTGSVIFVLMLILALITGKKASLIMFISWYFFALFVSGKAYTLKFTRLIVLSIIGVFFIVFQYARSMGLPLNNLLNITLDLGSIVYYNMNSYLLEYEILEGWRLRQDYQELIGGLGQVTYFLNPFIKMLGLPGGVSLSLGPFLAYQRGSSTLNGVNPTLFYEFWMVYSWFGIIFLPLVLILVWYLMKNGLKKLKYDISLGGKAQAIFELQLVFFLLQDSLNAIRLLPFLILIRFIKRIRI